MENSSLPFGSNIQVDRTSDAVTYSWVTTDRHPMQRIPMLFGGVMLVQAVAMVLIFCFGQETDLTPGLFLISSVFLVSAGTALLWAGLKRRGCEIVELQADSVAYDNGPSVLPLPFMWFFGMPFLLGPQFYSGNTAPMPHFWRKKQVLLRELIGPFTLERVGERQRLRVDHGRNRLEIGTLLSEPEREWLAEELKAWQTHGLAGNTDSSAENPMSS